MPHVTTVHEVDAHGLEQALSARDDVYVEQRRDDGTFDLAVGPFRSYRRTVDVEQIAEDRWRLTERVDYQLAIHYWAPLFGPLYRRAIAARAKGERGAPWWSPPEVMSMRSAEVLSLLCMLALVTGYVSSLLTQVITFAADEFGASDAAQGTTLATVRFGALISIFLTVVADRFGRRSVLLWASALSCVGSLATAFAPSMAAIAGTQTFVRGLTTAVALLLTIMAAEEMPAGARAYAVSVMTMTGALGAGVGIMLLSQADKADWVWRALFAGAVVGILPTLHVARRLPETHRFTTARGTVVEGASRWRRPRLDADSEPAPLNRYRFWLLAGSGFLGALFFAPLIQFQNEFLRDERGFSAADIALFKVLTNTPGGIGIVVGGRLAETRGRRLVGAIGLAGGAFFGALLYVSEGPLMWIGATVSAIIGAATIPTLAVFGPELFPTAVRAKVSGWLTAVSVMGSALGLVLAGVLSDAFGGLGPAMLILAVGPAIHALLVATKYPETAHFELEDLNPEDQPVIGGLGGGLGGGAFG